MEASSRTPLLLLSLQDSASCTCFILHSSPRCRPPLYCRHEFKSQATDVEDVVLEAAQNATDSIHTVSAQIASVETILRPYSSPSFLTSLNSIENTLSEQANNVESKVLRKAISYTKAKKAIIYAKTKKVMNLMKTRKVTWAMRR
ncbi:unnamed protein product [Sphagnum compactum]